MNKKSNCLPTILDLGNVTSSSFMLKPSSKALHCIHPPGIQGSAPHSTFVSAGESRNDFKGKSFWISGSKSKFWFKSLIYNTFCTSVSVFKKRGGRVLCHPLPYLSTRNVPCFAEMANTRTYKSGVKIGNWYENLCLEEVCASFIAVRQGHGHGCSFHMKDVKVLTLCPPCKKIRV